MSAQVMSLFTRLSSPVFDERVSAAAAIMSHLKASNVPYPDHQPDEPQSPDFTYALRRLVRGLASPTAGARLGFSVVLCEMLVQFPQLSSSTVLDLIIASTPLQGACKASEERDAVFGRLFGIKCILQSGCLFRGREAAKPSQDTLNVLRRITDQLCTLMNWAKWMAESVGWVLVFDLAKRLLEPPLNMEWASPAVDYLVHKVFVQDKTFTLEKLALMVILQQHSVQADWQTFTLGLVSHQPVLRKKNRSQIYSLLTATNPLASQGDEFPGRQSAPEPPIRPHFIHKILIFSCTPKRTSELAPLYRQLLEDHYFTPQATPSRKSHGFLILIDLLTSDKFTDSEKPSFLSPNLVHTLTNQLAVKDRLLHKMAHSVVDALIDQASKGRGRGSALPRDLATQIRAINPQFDHFSRTKLLESLTALLSGPDLESWVKELVIAFNNGCPAWPQLGDVNVVEETEADRHRDHFREYIMSQLCAVIHNKVFACSPACATLVIECLVTCAFFGVKRELANSAESEDGDRQSATQSVPRKDSQLATISSAIREHSKGRLYTCLVDLLDRNRLQSQSKRADKHGVYSEEFRSFRVVDVALRTISTQATQVGGHVDSTSTNQAPKRLKALRDVLSSMLGQLGTQKFKINHPGRENLILMCEAVLLMTYDQPEEFIQVLPLFERLSGCLDVLLPQEEGSLPAHLHERAVAATKVLHQVLVYLISWPIAFLRTVVESVFHSFSEFLEADSLRLWTDLIDPPDDNIVGDNCSETSAPSCTQEAMSSNHDTNSHGFASTDEMECGTSEDGDAFSADEAFREEIAAALGHALAQEKIEDDASGDESEVLGDDEMLALDDNLAVLFQKHTGKKAVQVQNTHELHLRLKTLDLIHKQVVRTQRRPLLLARLLSPLLNFVRMNKAGEGEAHKKAIKMLQEITRLPCSLPTSPRMVTLKSMCAEEWSEIGSRVHQIARSSSTVQLHDLCGQCNVWLIGVLESGGPDLISDQQTPQTLQHFEKLQQESLGHFCFKKTTRLRPGFFTLLAKRRPAFLWRVRADVLKLAGDPAILNAYRRQQVSQLIWTLLSALTRKCPAQLLPELISYAHDLQSTVITELQSCTLSTTSKEACESPEGVVKAQGETFKGVLQLLHVTLNLVRKLKVMDGGLKVVEGWPEGETEELIRLCGEIPESSCAGNILRAAHQLRSSLGLALLSAPPPPSLLNGEKKEAVDPNDRLVKGNKRKRVVHKPETLSSSSPSAAADSAVPAAVKPAHSTSATKTVREKRRINKKIKANGKSSPTTATSTAPATVDDDDT